MLAKELCQVVPLCVYLGKLSADGTNGGKKIESRQDIQTLLYTRSFAIEARNMNDQPAKRRKQKVKTSISVMVVKNHHLVCLLSKHYDDTLIIATPQHLIDRSKKTSAQS